MFGVGLLEQIHPGDILANADPDDADGDGISGKPSMVRDPVTRRSRARPLRLEGVDARMSGPSRPMRSRATSASRRRTSRALWRLHRSPGRLPGCAERRAGAARRRWRRPIRCSTSSPSTRRNLAVPVRRDVDDTEVLAGKALFYEFGCADCHSAEICHPPRCATARTSLPAHLALYRPSASRHGGGARRPRPGRRCRRAPSGARSRFGASD